MSAVGHEHASRMPGRHGASASVTGSDRRSAANWKSVPITAVSGCSKLQLTRSRHRRRLAGKPRAERRRKLRASHTSVIAAGVNPHRLGLAVSCEAHTFVKAHGCPFRDQHMLMKAFIARLQTLHDLSPNPLSLVFGQNEQMGIVDNQVSVRNCVSYADQLVAVPR